MAEQNIIKPKRLSKGDTLALVAPASPKNEDEQVRAAIEVVQSLGFKVKEGAHLYARNGYLAGSDPQRSADLNAAFADEEVDGIIALCGGYGSPRILPSLDFDTIRANPKALIGYSDITALLNGIHHLAGLVTFHGPMASQAFTPYTLAGFKQVLVEGASKLLLGAPPQFEEGEGRVNMTHRIARIAGGKAQGRLVGGNLSLMATLCGTPYMPDLAGSILVLEDVGEATYRLDRMLTQLWLNGGLAKCAGIAFGTFTGCTTSASWAKQQTVEEVLVDRCCSLGVPALRGLRIGHVDDQSTLPLGCLAELDADAGTLALLEAGVF